MPAVSAPSVLRNEDLSRMQTWGRLSVTHNDIQAFENAAEYLALSLLAMDPGNYGRLWIWFEEGARNSVKGQHQLVDVQRRLKIRAEEIYEANKS